MRFLMKIYFGNFFLVSSLKPVLNSPTGTTSKMWKLYCKEKKTSYEIKKKKQNCISKHQSLNTKAFSLYLCKTIAFCNSQLDDLSKSWKWEILWGNVQNISLVVCSYLGRRTQVCTVSGPVNSSVTHWLVREGTEETINTKIPKYSKIGSKHYRIEI